MQRWAEEHLRLVSRESYPRFMRIRQSTDALADPHMLRYALLDFIADFANWDNFLNEPYLEVARDLTAVAHSALGGRPGTKPMVMDPFAGGGAIPLEALRIGADAFSADLNPVAFLLNKVMLEYVPKYRHELSAEVRRWGMWITDQARRRLSQFYVCAHPGETPRAYIWARTILSEAPDDGSGLPVEVPLLRSMWLSRRTSGGEALRWVRDSSGMCAARRSRLDLRMGRYGPFAGRYWTYSLQRASPMSLLGRWREVLRHAPSLGMPRQSGRFESNWALGAGEPRMHACVRSLLPVRPSKAAHSDFPRLPISRPPTLQRHILRRSSARATTEH